GRAGGGAASQPRSHGRDAGGAGLTGRRRSGERADAARRPADVARGEHRAHSFASGAVSVVASAGDASAGTASPARTIVFFLDREIGTASRSRGRSWSQPWRIARGSSIVTKAVGSHRSISLSTDAISRRRTTVSTISTIPSRPWPAYSVTPNPFSRSASASSTPP